MAPLSLLLAFLAHTTPQDPPGSPADGPARRACVVILDDVGWDLFESTRTPTLDRVAGSGTTCRVAISYPACSPTRATIESAAYGIHTGIGRVVRERNPFWLRPEHGYLARHARAAGRRVAFAGKWHLAPEGRLEHPTLFYPDFAGTPGNLWPGDYFEWEKLVDGELQSAEGYVTSDTFNDAVRMWRDGVDLLVISLHAAHKPLHVPPEDLYEGDYDMHSKGGRARAMLEAADTELGRFLREAEFDLGQDLLVVVSDNGTSDIIGGGKKEFSHAGVNVPLWFVGPGVQQGLVSDALVSTVDIAPTVLDLVLGAAPRALDGLSQRKVLEGGEGVRRHAYSEAFRNGTGPAPFENWTRMIFDGRWKLIERPEDETRMLFDLRSDPGEETNLLDDTELGDEARAALAELEARWPE